MVTSISNNSVHRKLLRISKINHPKLYHLIKKNGELCLKRNKYKDLFEFLARTLTGQQLSKAAADTIWSNIEKVSKKRGYAIQEFCVYKNRNRLRKCGLSNNKTKALMALNKAFAKKEISYEQICNLNYDEMSSSVMKLWGFGHWSADMVAIFFFAQSDIWPSSDTALNRGMQIILTNKISAVIEVSHYSPYRTFLAMHIWKGLDTGVIFDL